MYPFRRAQRDFIAGVLADTALNGSRYALGEGWPPVIYLFTYFLLKKMS